MNVFDIDTATIGNGYDYTATANDWVKAIDIPVEPNTTYTASYPIARYAFNHGNIVADYNKNTITTGSNTTSLSLFMYVGDYSGTVNVWFSNYMLNEGTTALPYQPYNQNKHITNNEAIFLKTESDRSANVKDLNYNNTNNGISLSIVNNKFTISGTNTKSEDLMIYNINLNPGTYTISIQNVSGTSSDNFRLVVHDHDWTYQRTVYFNANSYATFTVSPDDTNPLFLQVYGPASNNTINCSGYIMLNEGTTPLPYQPYEGKVVHEKDLGRYAKSIYGVSQLYKHDIQFDILNGDGIRCTFWSTSNVKITDFSQIPYLAFSNIQVKNITNDKILNVVQ